MKKRTLALLALAGGAALGAALILTRAFQAEEAPEAPEEDALDEERPQVVLTKPVRFEDADTVLDDLRQGRTVVVSLEDAGADTARRLVDFLTGAVSAGGGQIKKVASATYLISPADVEFAAPSEGA